MLNALLSTLIAKALSETYLNSKDIECQYKMLKKDRWRSVIIVYGLSWRALQVFQRKLMRAKMAYEPQDSALKLLK